MVVIVKVKNLRAMISHVVTPILDQTTSSGSGAGNILRLQSTPFLSMLNLFLLLKKGIKSLSRLMKSCGLQSRMRFFCLLVANVIKTVVLLYLFFFLYSSFILFIILSQMVCFFAIILSYYLYFLFLNFQFLENVSRHLLSKIQETKVDL